MPECQNCGEHVTEQYARVFTPDGVENPRVCPHCEDMTRDGAGVREKQT
jgi:NAD-dependent SIR2 family protein deacetylase